MKKLFHIYDSDNGNKVTAIMSETVPKNYINHIVDGQIDPRYDIDNDCLYDAVKLNFDKEDLCNKELQELDVETTHEISKIIFKYTQRKEMRGVPIPEHIIEKYESMRAEYHIKKNAILDKYGLNSSNL